MTLVQSEPKRIVMGGNNRRPGANTVAYYQFDGNLNDSSGNGHDMSIYSGTATYGTAAGGGKYIYLDNAWTNYWERSFDYDSGNTISFRVNYTTATSFAVEMWKSGTSYARISSNGRFQFLSPNNIDGGISAEERHLVTQTRTGSTVKCYVDGILVGTGTNSASGTNNTRIKFNNPGDTNASNYAGQYKMSEFIWEDKERTAQEVLDYYNQTKNAYQPYLPQDMTSDIQNGFTASGSTQIRGDGYDYYAFFVSTQGGTDRPWHSQAIGAGSWVYSQIEMPNPIVVNTLEIGARKNESSNNLRPIAAYVLRGSNDGIDWTEIKSVSGLGSSWSIGSIQTWSIEGQTTAYKYLKLEIQAAQQYVAFDYWNVRGDVIQEPGEREIKRVTMRKQEEQTTTIYGPSSEVYGNTNIYSDTAPSDGIYNFSAEVSAVSGYYGCINIIINGVTVETFRTSSTSYVPFTYQTTLNAGDSIVLYLYGEPNQNAGCRNVQIDTVAIDRTEKQIRPVAPIIEEYVMLSEGGATNRFNELSVDGSYQTVFNNTTNWYTAVTQTDKMSLSQKIFNDKEIVGFDLIFQYANPSVYSSVQFGLTTADKSKGFGSTDGQDSYSGWYGVRFEGDGPTTYVSGSVTTADVHIVGEKNGNTWTVNGSGGVTFSQTFTVDYIIQRVSCGAWMWFTGTTGYIKKLVLYLKDL